MPDVMYTPTPADETGIDSPPDFLGRNGYGVAAGLGIRLVSIGEDYRNMQLNPIRRNGAWATCHIELPVADVARVTCEMLRLALPTVMKQHGWKVDPDKVGPFCDYLTESTDPHGLLWSTLFRALTVA